MKEIGLRFEPDAAGEIIHIVELSEYEYEQLIQLCETRDLEKERTELELWADRFSEKIRSLRLSTRATNTVCNAVWHYARDGSWHNWAFQSGEGMPPMEFDEWAQRIVSTHDKNGRGSNQWPRLEFRNCGEKLRIELMAGIAEYVSGSDSA